MNIETLKELTGWKRPTINPTPTDLEIALARVNADHKSVLVAVKMLTEIAQSTAAGNLNMTVVHEERHKDVLKNMRELKKEMYHADQRHLAAFELALRPLMRLAEESNKRLTEKVNNLNADVHALRVDLNCDREAQARIQNTKLNAIAIRIDDLCEILDNFVKYLGQSLIKRPEGVTLTTPKKKQGRRTGDKNRTPEERYAYLKHRVQVARPGGKAQKKWQFLFTEFCNRTGMGK